MILTFWGLLCCARAEISACALFILTNFLWRCLTISNRELQINDDIRDREVRVVDAEGHQLGIMPAAQARQLAYSKDLDLVKIAPQAKPPVCKVIDYGKYRFEQAKREKESRKNQHIVEIKEVRLSLNIDTHDFETKLNHAIRFLKEGNKVKASIRFRGREMGHPEQGYTIMKKFAEALNEYAVVEKPAKLEGRNMLMFLAVRPVARPGAKPAENAAKKFAGKAKKAE
ncbi:translation initiation factor IF-3 [Ruminococcaceae bacterium CPB6]|uniref:Translation initiation factor IF-3 n=1 Tax=Caproicibacterium lactatifermentans TaxID=2666138 RepID=A0A859DS77_9FIRM|nr:translation initiation factor IF-3 [Ruminococcaceae bacterium CPB6]QKN24778.1 translation initiation factor IF-3 [Caproicibacterium lactatifermentans]QKO31241.1 translation initiation factor IF-3 [Caproicibacterium lactatifermentans]